MDRRRASARPSRSALRPEPHGRLRLVAPLSRIASRQKSIQEASMKPTAPQMSQTSRAMILVVLATCLLTLCACEVPPLQVTPQPRQQVTEPPAELPRIPYPDPAAAWVPAGYSVEVAVKDLI